MARRGSLEKGAAQAVLAVDVGNTTTSLGIVEDGALFATWSLTTPERMTADEARVAALSFLAATDGAPEVGDAIVASVVPGLTDAWVSAANALCGRRPLVVGPGLKTGVRMRYNDPGELGADRVADLAAAKAAYEPPFIVVDLGTTTNFEVVDADGCSWAASSRRGSRSRPARSRARRRSLRRWNCVRPRPSSERARARRCRQAW